MVTLQRERIELRPKTAMRHGKFDESDHEQDIENVSGSSIYFGLGFRGSIEQAMLKIEDDFDFEGYQYFVAAQLVDQAHALSAENSDRRSIAVLMKKSHS